MGNKISFIFTHPMSNFIAVLTMFLHEGILLKSVFKVRINWNFGCGFISAIYFSIFMQNNTILILKICARDLGKLLAALLLYSFNIYLWINFFLRTYFNFKYSEYLTKRVKYIWSFYHKYFKGVKLFYSIFVTLIDALAKRAWIKVLL